MPGFSHHWTSCRLSYSYTLHCRAYMSQLSTCINSVCAWGKPRLYFSIAPQTAIYTCSRGSICILHLQRRRKDFLIGGAQYVINYFVVQNIYGTDWKLGGARAPGAPLVSTPMTWSEVLAVRCKPSQSVIYSYITWKIWEINMHVYMQSTLHDSDRLQLAGWV